MYQRKANMKPAALDDNVRIPLGALTEFILNCELALSARGQEDEAFRFECIREYLQQEFTPAKGLHFKPGVIGL